MIKKILFSIFAIAFIQSIVFASQEGVLKLSNFTIESKGIGNSGPIIVTGTINEQDVFMNLRIDAFGNKYEVSKEDLNKIPPMFYNGIQLSYEEGYKELGGKTIYIIFQMGFTSGIDKKVLVSISEKGTVNIEDLKK